ncbi:hypothetical protein PG999_008672 [Apiospora kogelbergensis]|uniref:Uncharacterized protein n=1 Tax=Apiospora kogelbergensis TaxID=1337665 RepID=A0AAW0QL55_9PEZI
MSQCKAIFEQVRCGSTTGSYQRYWCEKHEAQHKVSHDFYKDVENEWERREDTFWNSETTKDKTEGLRLLSIVLVARQSHNEWFYESQPDDGHEDHELELRSSRQYLCRETYALGYAIAIRMTPEAIKNVIRERETTSDQCNSDKAVTYQHIDEGDEDHAYQRLVEKEEEELRKRKQFMDELLAQLHPIELVDKNKRHDGEYEGVMMSYIAEEDMFPKDSSHAEW